MKTNYLKLSTLALAGVVAFSSCKKVESKFTVNNPTAWVGEPVTIKDGVDAKLKKTSYTYDFGDGTQTDVTALSAGVKNPSHIYTKVGTYTITQQVSKPGMLGKTPKKSAESTQNVTIQMVTPALSVSNETPNSGEVVTITNKTDESSNKGSAPSYEVTVSGPSGVSNQYSYDGIHFAFTPSSSGSYIITLIAMQGDSKATASKTITVGGNGSDLLEGMLTGTWNIAISSSLTGTGYTGLCGAITYNSSYSKISINGTDVYYGIVANSGNTTTGAGNVENPNTTISVMDGNYVSISGSDIFNAASGSSDPEGPIGIYKVTSSSATSIVLTKTATGNYTTCAAGGTYSNTYTITLTR